jgi:tetratricopeptide (TPR) repeat protein
MGEQNITTILDSLALGEFAVFCGAGISRNSGLPLANELKHYMLERLTDDIDDIREVMGSALPFEFFMEVVSEHADISDVLGLFKMGKPNTNHILIARLAKWGFIRSVLTTNFDLLIERAMQNEGLKERINFVRHYRKNHFRRIWPSVRGRIPLIKVHGTADDSNSVLATLRTIASEISSTARMSAIEYLFSTGMHDRVLILGYSCSDIFDIVPQIQLVEESRKEVIFVEHSEQKEPEIEDIRAKQNGNPFKGFRGSRVRCNTDWFVEKFWNHLGYVMGAYGPVREQADWRSPIDSWAKRLENNITTRDLIMGLLFQRISDSNKAIVHYNRALDFSKGPAKSEEEAMSYAGLGIAYGALGDFKRAIDFQEMALSVSRKIGNKTLESACLINLGSAYGSLGELKKEIKYYENAVNIAREIGEREQELRSYIGLGVAYYFLGRFKRAIKYENQALRIAKNVGNKIAEAKSYMNLGNAHYGLDNFMKAIDYYRQSLETYQAIGNEEGESKAYNSLAAAYGESEDWLKSIECGNKALVTAQDIGNKDQEARAFHNLGDAYRGLRDMQKAAEYLRKALPIRILVGDKVGQSYSYEDLGLVWQDIGDLRKAAVYLLKAVKLAHDTGQSHRVKSILLCLHNLYENLGDEEAVKRLENHNW